MDYERPAADHERDAASDAAPLPTAAASDIADSDIRAGDGDDEIDAAAVRTAIRTHGERIKQRELRQAMSRLDAEASLTPAQRRILREMASEIVDSVLASPEAALAETDDAATLRTAVELFDPAE